MSVISNLDVILAADTRKFDPRIKKSGSVFGSFAKSIGGFTGGSFARATGVIAGTIGTYLAVSSAIGKVNEQFDKIDSLAKFADEVDANVSELQALNLQAELTGTKTETLQKGIQRFTRRLGEARKGMGEGVKALGAFGLSADELSKMSLSEQLATVADKINEQETAADRAALAYGLFGRQGQELMTLFTGGGEGIRAAADDIERFGVGLTRVEAAQVEQTNDAFTRLNTLIDGVFQKIAVEAAPTVTALVESFTEGASAGGMLGDSIGFAFEVITSGIGFALDGWNVFMGGVEAGRAFFITSISQMLNSIGFVEDALVKFGGQEFNFGIRTLQGELDREAAEFAKKAGERFGDGFGGVASQEFSDKLAEIKARAEQAVAEQSGGAVAETKSQFKLPAVSFGSILDAGKQLASNAFGALAGMVEKIPIPEAPEIPEQQSEGPSVGALAAGSSAAISAIIGARRNDSSSVESEIRKAHAAELAEAQKQTKAIKQLGKAKALVVSLLGGGA